MACGTQKFSSAVLGCGAAFDRPYFSLVTRPWQPAPLRYHCQSALARSMKEIETCGAS